VTTSPKTPLKLNDKGRIVLGQLGYARQKLRNRAHNLLHSEMNANDLTQSEISILAGKDKSSLSRLLGAPNNFTLDTLSDLILAITGKEVALSLSEPNDAPKANFDTMAWLEDQPETELVARVIVERTRETKPVDPTAQSTTASAIERSDLGQSDMLLEFLREGA